MPKPSAKSSEQQNPQSQAQEVAPRSQTQPRSQMRGAGFDPFGLIGTPGAFLPMTPFSLMRKMTEEMDRVFHEYASTGGASVWAPAIEVSEGDGKLVVKAELPGLNPSDVKVQMTDEAIILQGERKSERDETKGGVHVTERHYGKFYRQIPLPEGADGEQAHARFENGVLELTVPLRQQQNTSREIPIETSAATSAGTAGNAA